MNVSFYFASSGGYNTKWRIYLNGEIIFEPSYFADYDVLVPFTYDLHANDELYFETWHSNSANAQYNILRVFKNSVSNKIITNGENILCIDDKYAKNRKYFH